MVSTRTISWIAVLLAVVLYRSSHVVKNCILIKSPLPVGYIAGGDYSKDCATLKDPAGSGDLKYCEDAAFWEVKDGKKDKRVLLFSCDSGRKSWNTVMGPLRDPTPRGSLWVLNPETSQPQRITLKNYPEEHTFHPLGLEAYPSRDGKSSNLYVVNHARERTTVEQFTLSPKDLSTATYVRTITSPYFISPNAVALTSPDSFYVTNDHLFTRRLPVVGELLPIAESVLALPLGFMLHVNLEPNSAENPIQNISFAAPFIPFANGVAISPSGTQVALASTSLGEVFLYERDPATNSLTKKTHTIPVPFTPDNIRYTSDNEIIVAGHPHFPSLTHAAANLTSALAQSWVVRIRPVAEEEDVSKFDILAPVSASTKVSSGKEWTIETLFQSDGSAEGFESSSTGLRDPETGTVYVSGLYAKDGVLKCQPGKGSA